MTTPTNDKLVSWACSVGLWPGAPTDPHFLPGGIGPRFIPVVFDFTANGSNGADQDYDLTLSEMIGNIGSVQSMFIDNSANAADPLKITFKTGQQKISIPKNSQALMPIFEPSNPLRFTVSATGLVLVPIFFINVPVAPAVWVAS